MLNILLETAIDTLKSVPFLYLVYLCLEYFSQKRDKKNINFNKLNKFGPIVASGLGLFPQCGFSAAAAALYNENIIKGGTLIAIFLATSDEALPVMFTNINALKFILPMLILKFLFGIIFGFILNYSVFLKQPLKIKNSVVLNASSCEVSKHHHHKTNKKELFIHAFYHAIKISAFIFITMCVINLLVYFLGQNIINTILLKESIFSPIISAGIGLIPGCSVSVLITELFINGSLKFSAAFAGLSAGAGFGYITLFKGNKKNAVKIIALSFAASAAAGIILSVFGY